MYVLYDDTRSFIHEMNDDRIMKRTCLRQWSVIRVIITAYPTEEVVRQPPIIIFHFQCYSRMAVLCP